METSQLGDRTEVEEIIAAKKGDMAAMSRLIEGQMGLVIRMAGKYATPGVSKDDLVQEGRIGVWRAIEKFNPEKAKKLSTYAKRWIAAKISRYLENNASTVRIPSGATKDLRHILQLLGSLKKPLSDEDLLKLFNKTYRKEGEARLSLQGLKALLLNAQPVLSLDAAIRNRDGDTLRTSIPSRELSVDIALDRLRVRGAVQQAVSAGTEVVGGQIVEKAAGLNNEPQTISAIGTELGIGREQARYLHKKSLVSLQRSLKEGLLDVFRD